MENTDFHTTTHTPESFSLYANADKEPAPKKPRGRPAKYAKEEREQKYKESRVQWNRDHKEVQQRYYQNNHEKLSEYSKEYHEKTRIAFKLLSELWNHPEYLKFEDTDPLRLKIENLFKEQKIKI